MSGNNLKGDIEAASAIFERFQLLDYLDMSYNFINGNLPDLNLPSITYLNLYGNRITGTIPDFQGIPNIQHIEIHGNELEGTIPDFSGIQSLKTLWIGESEKITGIN